MELRMGTSLLRDRVTTQSEVKTPEWVMAELIPE